MTLEEQESAIRAACAALKDVPGARVTVGRCALTEADVEYFARVFPKASVSRDAYAADALAKSPHFIVGFHAELDGVAINGQTAPIEMSRADVERVGRLFQSSHRYLTVEEALREVPDVVPAGDAA